MNEKQAKDLLDYTFNKEFDLLNFSNLLKELLNTSNLYKQDKTPFIDKQFKNYILNVTKLGQYKDTSNKSVEILAVKLANHSSLDRARTMQRNFISTWLSKNSDEPIGALVAFYSDEKDWRFSFVKLEYSLMKDERGNLKAKKELTPAKRYSFLVGPHEPNHTCKSQFVHLLVDDHDPTLEEIEKSFGIEKVTKEFFENYKKRFLELKESLEKVIKRDANVKEEFMKIVQDDEEQLQNFTVEFSKKLLGQIVFLYFLQKKGWLGVQKEENGRFKKWGTGPKDFMRRLFKKEYGYYKNFFNDILEPLFYNTLAVKRPEDYSDKFNCKIPFLNGGLFEPLDGYDWINTNINLDDNIFKEILDTFDEFNFTVKEDEPLEKEVAVDPEMLGKVFENLLDVIDRKSKGAFYTPREIVHYMCQQSLINYLETNSSISREDIEKFIEMGDITTSNDERILIQINEKQEKLQKGIINSATFSKEVEELSNQLNLPKSIVQNKEQIDKLLKDIKVVDPAVGSGAFPVGMMNEIVKARSILSLFFSEERNVYDIKRECIENSLYGVDIMPSAVDICQLRFWLSLIVDEDDKDKVKPLPNLDNKIMCGNSLLEEFEGVKLFDDSLLGEEVKDIRPELTRIDNEIKELNLKIGQIITGKLKGDYKELKKEVQKKEREKKKLLEKPSEERNTTLNQIGQVKRNEAKIKLKELNAKQKEFFNSFDRDTKAKLKKEIDRLEWELIKVTLEEQGNEEALDKLDKIMRSKSKPFFLWKLNFMEVFQRENPGFDVVIANPPYVRQEDIKEYKPLLQNSGYEVYNSTSDLYTYFYELSYKILRTCGASTYISSNKWLRAKYGEKLRIFFQRNVTILEIVDFGPYKVFDTASVDTNLLFFRKTKPVSNPSLRYLTVDSTFDDEHLAELISKKSNRLLQSELKSEAWTLAERVILNLKRKIEEKGTKLKEQEVKILRGLITGFNEAFIIDKTTKDKISKIDDASSKLLKPVLRGRDISKYHHNWEKIFIIKFESGMTNKFRGNANPEKYFNSNYKGIASHFSDVLNKIKEGTLKAKGKGLLNRDDKGDYWWELRDCDYYSEFEKEKIIYPDIAPKLSFTLESDNLFLTNTAYFIISKDNKFFLGVLNTSLLNFYYRLISSQLGGKAIRHFSTFIEQLPAPNGVTINKDSKIKIRTLVDQILSITKEDDYLDNPDKQAKVKRLEKEIDQLVYKLYELTPEEIKIVEGFGK